MPKVLINGLQISNKNSGVQYYTQNLYSELIKLQNDKFGFDLKQSSYNNFRSFKNNRFKRILFENLSLPIYLKNNNFNLFHSPNYVLPFFFNFPSVLTIHDLITLDYPELCQNESVLYFRLLLPRSIKRATKIITVSNAVKNDILRHLSIPEKKIEVIYHGVNPIFKKSPDKTVLKKYHLPKKYIFFVGNLEPKKNLERLITAFSLLKKNTNVPHKLVLAGKKGWKYKAIFNTVARLKLNKEVIFTGYIPEEDLPTLYSSADLFAFPSLYEGFGIPPLEAMACEVPVLTSYKGALPETTGGNCIAVDPYQVNEIAAGMYQILKNTELRLKLISNGRDWVKQFSWEKTAKKTLMVYEQAINMKNVANNP